MRPSIVVLFGMLFAGTGVLGGCATTAPGPEPVPAPPPPPQPAACLLDEAALQTATGLVWAPDRATAGDTRCVYDPSGAERSTFVAVDLEPLGGTSPVQRTSTLAQVCTDAPTTVSAGDGAFVCRFQGGSVFGAVVDGDHAVTVSASAVPSSITADALTAAFIDQLVRIAE